MQRQLILLGALHIAASILYLLIAGSLSAVLYGTGLLQGIPTEFTPDNIAGAALGVFLLLRAIPGLLAGIGLMRQWQWCKTLALILGCLDLVTIPIGTALGIYTIWAVMRDYDCRHAFRQAPAAPVCETRVEGTTSDAAAGSGEAHPVEDSRVGHPASDLAFGTRA